MSWRDQLSSEPILEYFVAVFMAFAFFLFATVAAELLLNEAMLSPSIYTSEVEKTAD